MRACSLSYPKIWKYTGKATVDGALAAETNIIFTYRNF